MRPFRFGVQLAGARDAKAWRARARQAEDLGYSTLFMPDHLDTQWAPLVALTVAAEATTSLRVGSLVFNNDLRHPVTLAREIATLDLVSAGRVEVGLGAGWLRRDYRSAGLPFDAPGTRIDRLAEAIRVLGDLWATGGASHTGRHYTVRGAQGQPRPHSVPRPPLLIGGGGRRMLALAAREADIVGVNPTMAGGRVGDSAPRSATAAAYDDRVAWVAECAGERMADVELQCMTSMCQVVPNREEMYDALGSMTGVPPEGIAEAPNILIGTVDQICDTLIRRRARYGFSYWVVHEQEMAAFGQVIARLAGT